jgi:hypothetical protein
MLIESSWVLEVMIATKRFCSEDRSPTFNPVPAMIIYILGSTMSAHHQASKVSTMLHAQWGKLFQGFALARVATYVTLYLRPVNTARPQRPPTEVIASFCLMTGGMMLMLSNRDTVQALEYNALDAMFVSNVTIGFTLMLMAWTAVCLTIKGWAKRSRVKCRKEEDQD